MRFIRKYAINALFSALAIAFAAAPTSSVAKKSGTQHWDNREILGAVGLVMAADMADSNWKPFGTGVFIDVDTAWPSIFFVMNRHIYLGRDSLKISYKRYKQKGRQIVFETSGFVIHRDEHAFCPSSEDSDFVAIVLKRKTALGVNAVSPDKIISFNSLKYGEQVVFYGYPQYDLYGLGENAFKFPVARGGILSYFANEEVYYKKKKVMIPKMFLVDGVSLGGGSGSPIFIKRPYINKDALISYDNRLAGIIMGHYPFEQTITIPFSKMPMISRALDDTIDVRDSLYISKFLTDFQLNLEENSDLAIAISVDLISDYIKQQYRQNVIDPIVEQVLLVMRYWQ